MPEPPQASARAAFVPLHHGGEKGILVINALLKIIVRANLSTKAVIAHLYYTELLLISSLVVTSRSLTEFPVTKVKWLSRVRNGK